MDDVETAFWKRNPHFHVGSIDDDCGLCGYSVYMNWHKDGFSETEIGDMING